MARDFSTETPPTEQIVPPRAVKERPTSETVGAARLPGASAEVKSAYRGTANSAEPLGHPEGKYSLNTLLAAGMIGFVVGRIFAR